MAGDEGRAGIEEGVSIVRYLVTPERFCEDRMRLHLLVRLYDVSGGERGHCGVQMDQGE